jgi:NAD(P)H-flavin reductase
VLDNRADYGRVTILFGCLDPTQRLFTDELSRWKDDPTIRFLETVDRPDAAWRGNTGVITSLIPAIKDHLDPSVTCTMLVGPPVMYKFVILELKNLGFGNGDIILSLERHMKCGVGRCGHCQVNGMYVCREGPVMNYESLIGSMEAL